MPPRKLDSSTTTPPRSRTGTTAARRVLPARARPAAQGGSSVKALPSESALMFQSQHHPMLQTCRARACTHGGHTVLASVSATTSLMRQGDAVAARGHMRSPAHPERWQRT